MVETTTPPAKSLKLQLLAVTVAAAAVVVVLKLRARRFVIATGSSAAVPPIPGLDRVP